MGSKARKGIVGKVNWKLSVLIFFFFKFGVCNASVLCSLSSEKVRVFILGDRPEC